MDILVYEHILGEEFSDKSSSLILHEAILIAKFLIKDFAELYPNSKISLLANKKNKKFFSDINIEYRDYNLKLADDIAKTHKRYKNVLILAPEENMVMFNLVKNLENKGINLINCNSDFIKTTTCKKNTYKFMQTSKEHLINSYLDYKEMPSKKKIVAKISDGLGSGDLYIFKNRNDLEDNIAVLTKKHFFQDYKEGKIISINIVSNKNKFKIISINEQIYEHKCSNEISLKEIFIGKYNHMNIEFKLFTQSVMNNFYGEYGFFGIDAILDKNNNIFLLEINPRLTTSYIGLRSSLGFNPAILLEDIDHKFNINNNKIFLEKIKNER